jgi:hypothetical protein
MFGLRLPKIVPDDFVEGVQFRTRHKRAATRAALLCLVEAGGIFAPSMALTLRAIGFADVHFGILPS